MKGTVTITAKLTITMANNDYAPGEFDFSVFDGEEGNEKMREMLKETIEETFTDTLDGWTSAASVSDVNVDIIEEQNK